MILNTYQKFLVGTFFKSFILITIIFLCLGFILGILEEIVFFKELDVGLHYPIFLTLLNIPSIVFDLFPFIFLISTQYLFLKFFENDELNIFKSKGFNNLKILKIITFSSFILGILIICFYYSLSSSFKHSYLQFKNKFTKDNKYIAIINDTGLWIKEENNDEINIINAKIIEENILKNINLTKLNNNTGQINILFAERADISNKTWIFENVFVNKENKPKEFFKKLSYDSNFDYEKIRNLFSNLSSLNIFQLTKLKNDYDSLGYSNTHIKSHMYKLISLPLYLVLMTVIGCIIMFNTKYKTSITLNLALGIFASSIIYYLTYFFNLLGTTEKIPLLLSIFLPYVILTLFCLIGTTNLNEK